MIESTVSNARVKKEPDPQAGSKTSIVDDFVCGLVLDQLSDGVPHDEIDNVARGVIDTLLFALAVFCISLLDLPEILLIDAPQNIGIDL